MSFIGFVTELLNVCYNYINNIDISLIFNKIYGVKRYYENYRRISKGNKINILQNSITDSVVLDLFAGSGAVGLESISRGAKKAILCDKNKQAIQIINKNAKKMRIEDKVQILCIDYEKFLNNTQENFDFIYIDPPYNTDYISNSIKLINDRNLLAEDGIIIAETDEEERVKDEIDKLKISINIYDTRKYGRARLIFMRKE